MRVLNKWKAVFDNINVMKRPFDGIDLNEKQHLIVLTQWKAAFDGIDLT